MLSWGPGSLPRAPPSSSFLWEAEAVQVRAGLPVGREFSSWRSSWYDLTSLTSKLLESDSTGQKRMFLNWPLLRIIAVKKHLMKNLKKEMVYFFSKVKEFWEMLGLRSSV